MSGRPIKRTLRGDIYYIAYRWDGREYRESARSAQRGVAEHLLATRLRERRGSPPPADLTFDALAAWYLDDYIVRRLRTLDTARGRVANLRAVFGGWPATAITTEAIRDYQRRRRLVAAAAATVNRETSALSRMFHLAVRSRQLDERPVFPERLEENGPRQGFFEHAEYTAVRQQLPAPYQDVLDFAYYSGWRKREILDLRWDEVDESGGVVRLSPQRSKTRVGRVLPISPPIAAVLARRRATRRVGEMQVFHRDAGARGWHADGRGGRVDDGRRVGARRHGGSAGRRVRAGRRAQRRRTPPDGPRRRGRADRVRRRAHPRDAPRRHPLVLEPGGAVVLRGPRGRAVARRRRADDDGRGRLREGAAGGGAVALAEPGPGGAPSGDRRGGDPVSDGPGGRAHLHARRPAVADAERRGRAAARRRGEAR